MLNFGRNNAKLAIVTIYQDIYAPVQNEIIKLLGELDSNISFQAEIFVKNNVAQNVLSFINQRFGGKFGRGSNSNNEIEDTLRRTDFNEIDESAEKCEELEVVMDDDLAATFSRDEKNSDRPFLLLTFLLGVAK